MVCLWGLITSSRFVFGSLGVLRIPSIFDVRVCWEAQFAPFEMQRAPEPEPAHTMTGAVAGIFDNKNDQQLFFFPGVHLVLLDSDCVPVTLFEVAGLWTCVCLFFCPGLKNLGC